MFEKEPSFGTESKMNLKHISGPVSWTGFEFGNKAIHFFGDAHYSKEFNCEELLPVKCSNSKHYYPDSDCITIDGLIKAIFESSDKKGFYVDVFLESPYETKKNRNKQYEDSSIIGYIGDVSNYIIDRLNSGKDYGKTKFHPIDIRMEFEICDAESKNCRSRIFLDLFTLIHFHIYQDDIDDDVRENFLNDILDLFYKGSFDYYKSKNYILFIKNLINKLSDWENKTILHRNFLAWLNKILNHVNTYGLGGKTENSMYHSIRMLESLNRKEITFKGINISKYIQDFFENEKNELLNKLKDNPNLADEIFINIGVSIMDIATLTKLFKRIKNDDEPQVMIVFAGNDHIKSYVNFFTKILGLKPLPDFIINDDEEHIRCLINPNFSKIFGKWIDTNKTIKSLEIVSNPNPRKTPKKRKTGNVGIRKTPRKSKKIERFSEQYDKYY
jgi:hypothetical protein